MVGIDALPRSIVDTAQKNNAKGAAVAKMPTESGRSRGRKLSGTSQRARNPAMRTIARNTGGWNATPAWSDGSGLKSWVEFKSPHSF